MRFSLRFAPTLFATLACIVPRAVCANERHFAFSTESGTLVGGHYEVEPQFSGYFGRPQYYGRLEYRLEFEVGITDRLQAAFYVNGETVAANDANGVRQNSSGLTSTSAELKYRLLDPVADPIGLAVYSEVTVAPDYLELEGKLIADRRIGSVLLAANVIFEHSWRFDPMGTIDETELYVTAGAGYFVTPSLMFGIELLDHNVISPMRGWETSALYAGGTVAFSAHHWWLAFSVLPQVAALRGHSPNDVRAFDDNEVIDARLVLGLMF